MTCTFRMAGAKLLGALLSVTMLLLLAAVNPARADFGLSEFSTSMSDMQAGGHPDFTTTFALNVKPSTSVGQVLDGHIKDVRLELPPGLVGNPQAMPHCKVWQLHRFVCPPDTQIGVAGLDFMFFGQIQHFDQPVYNIEPSDDQPADFGFIVIASPQHLLSSVRTGGDYGITTELADITEFISMQRSSVTLWGVPGDTSHDAQRYRPNWGPPGVPFQSVSKAFMTNPSTCGTPLTVKIAVDSWDLPGHWVTATSTTPGPITGCDQEVFRPSVSVATDVHRTSSPTGLTVDVAVPQTDSPLELSTPTLRKAVVTLPQGFAISPAAAQGLGACPPGQIDLANATAPSCPDASKIGTVTIDTPLLASPLQGSVYLAQQGENPFGSTYAMYVDAAGHGVRIKLAGRIAPDPQTGQLTATFDDAPQQPFSHFTLKLFGGPRAVVVTPPECGTYATKAQLTSYASETPVSVEAPMAIDDGCSARGFAPAFHAGGANSKAGSANPLSVAFSRTDGDQLLGGITAELPAGLLGRIASVPLCPDAQASAGTCADASRIGTVSTQAGAGPLPLPLPGRVYLTGPYKGAPFGLSIVVPAIAGPFDLGTVVVRAAIFVDPTTAALRIVSDPLPTILDGIPLQIRSVNILIDRPGFMRNPTSCAPSEITAAIQSTAGAVANVSSRFQVADCAALPFAPKMAIRLTNRSQTTDGRHPGLDVFVTQSSGQANLKKVVAKLPLSLALDPENTQSLCEYADGLKDNCPPSSEIGTAEVVTPLLKKHLYGKVYFVRGVRFNSKGRAIRTLPTLLILLRGEINLDLRASSTVDREGRLVTTFDNVPDAAISGFRMQLRGGKHGILVVTDGKNVCKGTQTTDVESDGQNGKTHDFAVKMTTPCSKASKAKKTRTSRSATTRKSAAVRRR